MNKHKGFTIIEVVLVLAIAGLIFMMVFITLPALQRNQRDAQRRNDMNAMIDAFQRCSANNRGRCNLNVLISRGYLKANEWKDPSIGESYVVNAKGGDSTVYSADWSAWEIGRVYWNQGGKCIGNTLRDIHETGRVVDGAFANFVAATKLENGGIICVSNMME